MGCDTFVGCGLHESILVLYYNVCMKVCLCYIIYLYVCGMRMYIIHCTYTCKHAAGYRMYRCHALCHIFCNLFTLQLTCEKDVGMGLCTFNFVLRLSLHLVCLLFGTSSLHLFNFFWKFFIDLL